VRRGSERKRCDAENSAGARAKTGKSTDWDNGSGVARGTGSGMDILEERYQKGPVIVTNNLTIPDEGNMVIAVEVGRGGVEKLLAVHKAR
jgi:hypothetical protein